jgi:hypothetical protein
LFRLDSANGPFGYGDNLGGTDLIRPIVNTSSGAKLFLQRPPNLEPIYVYSLCGTLPTDIFDFLPQLHPYLELYPNPSAQKINFKIHSTDNINNYELVIVDGLGNELHRCKINGTENE